MAGLAMAQAGLDLVPIVDGDGALRGVVSERALARRYIRETRQTSTLQDSPTQVSAVVDVLEGELVAGEDRPGRRAGVGLLDGSRDPERHLPTATSVVVGDRADAQRLAIERGAALVIVSNGARPDAGGAHLGRRARARRSSSPRSTPTSAPGW